MMAGKARLFGDGEMLAQILAAAEPLEAKRCGRKVRGFVPSVWSEACVPLVVHGNLAKFGQNEALGRYLLDTGERVLVEASPRDVIWGIGLGASNERARDPRAWRGAISSDLRSWKFATRCADSRLCGPEQPMERADFAGARAIELDADSLVARPAHDALERDGGGREVDGDPGPVGEAGGGHDESLVRSHVCAAGDRAVGEAERGAGLHAASVSQGVRHLAGVGAGAAWVTFGAHLAPESTGENRAPCSSTPLNGAG
jgi:ribA/ribD-fused uncharacterized protein